MDKIVHFEIPADHLERAQKFYQETFGWQIISSEIPGMEYRTVRTVAVDKNFTPKSKGAINGGLMKRSAEAHAPVLVINVASIDEALKQVQIQGGALVTPKIPVGKMGFYARFKDTEGNILGLWEDVKKHHASK